MKKAMELSVLCDCDIALIVFGMDEKVYQYSSASMEALLGEYKDFEGSVECLATGDVTFTFFFFFHFFFPFRFLFSVFSVLCFSVFRFVFRFFSFRFCFFVFVFFFVFLPPPALSHRIASYTHSL